MDNTRQPYILQNGIGAIPPRTPRCRQPKRERVRLSGTKRYRKATAAKYVEAIGHLKTSRRPTAEGTKSSAGTPETFREYLYEHEPELAASPRYDATCERQAGIGPVRGGNMTKRYTCMQPRPKPLKSIALKLACNTTAWAALYAATVPMGEHRRNAAQLLCISLIYAV